MARIALLSLVFAPDSVSTSVLMTELALDLRGLGHDIVVLSTTPHYNEDHAARLKQPLTRRWGGLLYESSYDGIPVYHASVPVRANRVGARLLDYARFHAISSLAGTLLAGDYDVVLAPSPPLTVGLCAWVLGRFRHVPFIYNVQEIYPDVAVTLGLLKNRPTIRTLEALERFIYRRARVITVISEWFRRRLIIKGVPADKVRVIHNFVDTEFMQPRPRQNDFSSAHGLNDKFVVLYAGNIGLTQGFETILSAADRLRRIPDLRVVIVGDGTRRSWIEKQLARDPYPNMVLLPYQPRSAVPDIYASSDLCLVPLKRGTAQETFPSKVYTIMAAARPVVVSADPDSELAWVVEHAECGWAIPPDDDSALAHSISQAYAVREKLPSMGTNGRAYVVAHHSRQVVTRQYDELIRELTVGR